MTDTKEPARLSAGKSAVFAAITLCAFLLLAELALRATGLAGRCRSQVDESGLWACDPILTFRLKPTLAPDGHPLNRGGFRTREFTPKPPGVYRVLALGDSCTFGIIATSMMEYVPSPYPVRLEQIVAERARPGKVEVLNAGVPGYNTFHGIMLLRTKLRGLRPDLITVRYGWNDLLVSGGRHAGSFREPDNALILGVQDLLLRTALYPFMTRLSLEVQAFGKQDKKPTPAGIPKEWKPNVPLEEYKRNLRRIAELGRAQGAEVWFLTTPQAFDIDENKDRYDKFPNTMAAKTLIIFSGIPSFQRLIEIHDSYNATTRETGAALGVPVIDMDALYRQHSSEHLFSGTDVLHPTQKGHDLEAEALYRELVARGIVHPTSG